jgi:mono/diheme cytochrome c family protein
MRIGRNPLVVFLGVLLIAAAAATFAGQKASSTRPSRVERGRYLVLTSACDDCHTPKLDAQGTLDLRRRLSGRPLTTMPPSQGEGEIRVSLDMTAWSGPWGISFAANLTPDPETGLGKRYTEASFVQTIRTGKKPEGEPLLPPMPWPVYKNMTDEDLKSIYAYLRTVKPIRNAVRTAVPVTPAPK